MYGDSERSDRLSRSAGTGTRKADTGERSEALEELRTAHQEKAKAARRIVAQG
jgi:hypothetical protein